MKTKQWYYYILIYDEKCKYGNHFVKFTKSKQDNLTYKFKKMKPYNIRKIYAITPYVQPIKLSKFKRIVRGY